MEDEKNRYRVAMNLLSKSKIFGLLRATPSPLMAPCCIVYEVGYCSCRNTNTQHEKESLGTYIGRDEAIHDPKVLGPEFQTPLRSVNT